MMKDDKSKKQPAIGALARAVTTLGSELIPFSGVVGELLSARQSSRVAEVLEAAFSATPVARVDLVEFRKRLEEEPFCLETIHAAILDEESQKVWFYGALLGHFVSGTVLDTRTRSRMLRIAKLSSNDELELLTVAGEWIGRHMEASESVEAATAVFGELPVGLDFAQVAEVATVGARTIIGRIAQYAPGLGRLLQEQQFMLGDDLTNDVFRKAFCPVFRSALNRKTIDVVAHLRFDPPIASRQRIAALARDLATRAPPAGGVSPKEA